jgi:predicted dithiol-disulfide oxidoreductase (DUF899 family)
MNRIIRREEWIEERLAFLAEEKEMTRKFDAFNARRRALPWVEVEKAYRFEGASGGVPLAGLFAGRSQLVVYHFMFGADWEEGCPSCSLWTDSFQGTLPHLAARDVTIATVSTAPYEKLAKYRERMGWMQDWYSAASSDFNRDFNVSYSAMDIESGDTFYNYQKGHHYGPESPGLSVFFRDPDERLFHTYSCYARGLEGVSLVYPILDRVPKGRDEGDLPAPQAWVRRKDQYGSEA